MLVVDGGNMLFRVSRLAPGGKEKRLAMAKAIIEAQKSMGIDAANVGIKDLAAGLDFIEQTEDEGFPWLSSNLRAEDGKAAGIPAYRIVKVNGARVGFLGLLEDPGPSSHRGYMIADPYESARRAVNDLRKGGADMVVALSAMTFEHNRQLADKVKGINLIISSGDSRMLRRPHREKDTLIMAALDRGKYLGVAEIYFDPANPDFVVKGESEDVKARLARVEAQKRIFEGRVGKVQEVQSMLAELEREERELRSRLESTDKPAGELKNSMISVEASVPDREDVRKILQAAGL